MSAADLCAFGCKPFACDLQRSKSTHILPAKSPASCEHGRGFKESRACLTQKSTRLFIGFGVIAHAIHFSWTNHAPTQPSDLGHTSTHPRHTAGQLPEQRPYRRGGPAHPGVVPRCRRHRPRLPRLSACARRGCGGGVCCRCVFGSFFVVFVFLLVGF